ncbi:SDR family NAD(P)-dependent oxidoreductase, partial [Streptomyces sp. MP131-18]|uniref:SDR family NAD(P)-dependent oxidoreductase n=1 Tax=Streptomyces sp. MP131-18 TaxID=1857892 RepID=UPI00209B84CA
MERLPAGGAMLAVAASEDEVRAVVESVGGVVGVAAVNGPSAVVVSGVEEQVLAVGEVFAGRGVRTRRLRVSHAFHSPLMDPMLEEFAEVLGGVEFGEPVIPVVSNVTGGVAGGGLLGSAEYWVRHVREAVRFGDGVSALVDEGVGAFLELGPDGVLTGMVEACLDTDTDTDTGADAGAGVVAVAGCRRGREEVGVLLGALAGVWVAGVGVDWGGVIGGSGGGVVDLPTYAFERERFWLESGGGSGLVSAAGAGSVSGLEGWFWDAVERGDVDGVVEGLSGAGVVDREVLGEVLPVLSSWRLGVRERAVVDEWRYRVEWRGVSGAGVGGGLSGVWVVVVPEGVVGDEVVSGCVAGLESAGAGGVVVVRADGVDMSGVVERAGALDTVSGVVSLLAWDGRAVDGVPVLSRGWVATRALVLELAAAGFGGRLWCVTEGAVSTGPGDVPAGPGQSMVWGLGRVAGLEFPDLWGGLVDVPVSAGAGIWPVVAGVLGGGVEDQVAVRPGGAFARRVVRAGVSGTRAHTENWQPSGTVLVTGGTGGLGARVARWAVANGAERVVLTSRRGLAGAGAAELRDELASSGADVTVAACDVADREALADLIGEVETSGPPVRGVVHAAGVAQFSGLAEADIAECGRVVEGKVAGAVNLDAVFGDRDLDAFVLFSSIAGVWGSGGQGAYAAGNAFLDTLAEVRRERGLAATSVAWGPWAEDGMAVEEGAQEALARRGLRVMDPGSAVGALAGAVGLGEVTVTVADVDWERFALGFTSRRASPLLGELAEVVEVLEGVGGVAGSGGADDAGGLAGRLAEVSAGERRRMVLELVRGLAAGVLGHADMGVVGAERPFRDAGFDSLTAVELRNRLVEEAGVRVSATAVFDHPTPAALTDHLLEQL